MSPPRLLRPLGRMWENQQSSYISGDDKLGGEKVDDPSSPFLECIPMPVIMIAHMECIMYTKVLRPMRRKVLDSLNDLVKDNKRCRPFIKELVTFIAEFQLGMAP